MPARFDVKLTGYAFACGIQEKSDVSLRKDNRKRGNKITDYFSFFIFEINFISLQIGSFKRMF